MRIYKYRDGALQEAAGLSYCLGLEQEEQNDNRKPEIISVVGGGGKTSFVYQLGAELLLQGECPVICTTTHMKLPKRGFVHWNDSARKAKIAELMRHGIVPTVGILCEDDTGSCYQKIKGIPESEYFALKEITDILIVEADGSGGLPLKVPAAHEPVIFPGTTKTIGVIGADALGRPLKDVCHRAELARELLDKRLDECVETTDLVQIIKSDQGLQKNMQGDYYVFVNKLMIDKSETVEIAKQIETSGENIFYGQYSFC